MVFGCRADCGSVDIDNVLDLWSVSTSHGDRYRSIGPSREFKHHLSRANSPGSLKKDVRVDHVRKGPHPPDRSSNQTGRARKIAQVHD